MHSSTLLNILAIAAVANGACTGPPVNQATVDLVASFEGFRGSVYTDATGHPTIGYGHLCQQSGCAEVPFPKPLSEADGKKLLAQDLGVSLPLPTTCMVINGNSLPNSASPWLLETLSRSTPISTAHWSAGLSMSAVAMLGLPP